MLYLPVTGPPPPTARPSCSSLASMTPVAGTPAALLDRAVAADPSRPLLTFYDDATGERTELSVATFANWVAKTANLVRDDLDLAPGARVSIDLPLHWQAAVWLAACWELRLVVVLPSVLPSAGAGAPADLAVLTHDRSGSDAGDAGEVVSLGLGPMGLARDGHVPAYSGALDYDREVHGHGDRFTASSPARGQDPALVSDQMPMTAADLAGAALAAPPLPAGGRLLVTGALATPAAVVGALLVPLATGVTAVLCRHLDRARLAHRATQENLVARLADPAGAGGAVPAWGALQP